MEELESTSLSEIKWYGWDAIHAKRMWRFRSWSVWKIVLLFGGSTRWILLNSRSQAFPLHHPSSCMCWILLESYSSTLSHHYADFPSFCFANSLSSCTSHLAP